MTISFTSIPCLPAAVLKAGIEDSDNIFEGEDFKAEFILLDKDSGNYQAKIKITNTKSSTIQNWALRIEFNSDIATIEQASILKHESNVYYIKGLNSNRNIAPDETVEFKISGTSSFVTSPSHYSMIEFQDFVNDLDYIISYQLENSWDSGYQGKSKF